MFSLKRKSPAVTAGLVAGLLAVAAPVHADAAFGHPADKPANAIARRASTGKGAGLAANPTPSRPQLQDIDTEI